MTKFDKIYEEVSNKSRKITRTERYPKNISFTRDFLDLLECEYFSGNVTGNRNYHSNFLKAISFEIDRFKDNEELASKHSVNDDMELEDPVDVIGLEVEEGLPIEEL